MSGKAKKYFCTFEGCGKSFNRRDYLDRHSANHLPVKPFHCTTCNRYFARNDLYENHLSTKLHIKRISQPLDGEGRIQQEAGTSSSSGGNGGQGSVPQNASPTLQQQQQQRPHHANATAGELQHISSASVNTSLASSTSSLQLGPSSSNPAIPPSSLSRDDSISRHISRSNSGRSPGRWTPQAVSDLPQFSLPSGTYPSPTSSTTESWTRVSPAPEIAGGLSDYHHYHYQEQQQHQQTDQLHEQQRHEQQQQQQQQSHYQRTHEYQQQSTTAHAHQHQASPHQEQVSETYMQHPYNLRESAESPPTRVPQAYNWLFDDEDPTSYDAWYTRFNDMYCSNAKAIESTSSQTSPHASNPRPTTLSSDMAVQIRKILDPLGGCDHVLSTENLCYYIDSVWEQSEVVHMMVHRPTFDSEGQAPETLAVFVVVGMAISKATQLEYLAKALYSRVFVAIKNALALVTCSSCEVLSEAYGLELSLFVAICLLMRYEGQIMGGENDGPYSVASGKWLVEKYMWYLIPRATPLYHGRDTSQESGGGQDENDEYHSGDHDPIGDAAAGASITCYGKPTAEGYVLVDGPPGMNVEDYRRYCQIQWTEWARYESSKRAAFVALFCDAVHKLEGKGASQLSIFDINCRLPAPDVLWNATSAEKFLAVVGSDRVVRNVSYLRVIKSIMRPPGVGKTAAASSGAQTPSSSAGPPPTSSGTATTTTGTSSSSSSPPFFKGPCGTTPGRIIPTTPNGHEQKYPWPLVTLNVILYGLLTVARFINSGEEDSDLPFQETQAGRRLNSIWTLQDTRWRMNADRGRLLRVSRGFDKWAQIYEYSCGGSRDVHYPFAVPQTNALRLENVNMIGNMSQQRGSRAFMDYVLLLLLNYHSAAILMNEEIRFIALMANRLPYFLQEQGHHHQHHDHSSQDGIIFGGPTAASGNVVGGGGGGGGGNGNATTTSSSSSSNTPPTSMSASSASSSSLKMHYKDTSQMVAYQLLNWIPGGYDEFLRWRQTADARRLVSNACLYLVRVVKAKRLLDRDRAENYLLGQISYYAVLTVWLYNIMDDASASDGQFDNATSMHYDNGNNNHHINFATQNSSYSNTYSSNSGGQQYYNPVDVITPVSSEDNAFIEQTTAYLYRVWGETSGNFVPLTSSQPPSIVIALGAWLLRGIAIGKDKTGGQILHALYSRLQPSSPRSSVYLF